MSQFATSYDEIPYHSQPFSRTRPASLAVMAKLFGMWPAPPQACRMLELGCAAGGNLIPLAASAPDSEFIGVDLSARQVEEGQALIHDAGLSNVCLEHMNILDVGSELGEFDYIVAHGVYSWVPPEVQDRMFAICRSQLRPQGVAYISYNTYPGWHLRATVREMMNYHARRFDDPKARIEQSRALLDFLLEANAGSGGIYASLLSQELELLQVRKDSYLFHEHLEEYNEPEYFYRFMERAAEAGLRFLGEASLAEMLPNTFDPKVSETVRRIAPDIIHMEQYLDFLRNRTFRRTLLCHDEVQLTRDLGPGDLEGLNFASPLVPDIETVDSAPGSEPIVQFVHPEGGKVQVGHPLEMALLMGLHEVAPLSVPTDDLVGLARGCLGQAAPGGAQDHAMLMSVIMNLYSAGFVEARYGADTFERQPGAQPRVSAVARAQAQRDQPPTNELHETVYMDEFRRRLICLLDGEHNRYQLVGELAALVEAGEMSLHRNEEPVEGEENIRAALEPLVEQGLADLGRLALLVA